MKLENIMNRIVKRAMKQNTNEWNGLLAEMLKYPEMRCLFEKSQCEFIDVYVSLCKRIYREI